VAVPSSCPRRPNVARPRRSPVIRREVTIRPAPEMHKALMMCDGRLQLVQDVEANMIISTDFAELCHEAHH
jgi:hypothetical protein